MPDTKISALTAATSVAAADQLVIVQGGVSKMATAAMIGTYAASSSYRNSSLAAVAGGYAADTYLAGSAVTVPAGAWKAGTLYQAGWDMVKTAAGTAAMTVIVRMGTAGTVADPAILTLTWSAGTAAIDTGWYELYVAFRSVGAGTAAVIQGVNVNAHHLAATGLHATGLSGTGIILGTSAGFASTTQTIIGISVNGGASFAGTNTIVQSFVLL